MKTPIVAFATLLLAWSSSFAEDKPPRFELLDGDRVVLIGGTMIERDQTYGYLETRLTRRYPDRKITFRNLGWSGDTVEGVSRAGFGPPSDGFKQLVDHVLALKPTVIFLGYGANESFEGKAGLPKFQAGLDKLLKAIEPTKARLVFLSPTRQENLGPPLPDPTSHNADLALYRDAIKVEAEKRGAVFVDLFSLPNVGTMAKPKQTLTDNGIHLTPYGYWVEAVAIEKDLFGSKRGTGPYLGGGEKVKIVLELSFEAEISDQETTPTGVRFKLRAANLPVLSPLDMAHPHHFDQAIAVWNLKPGKYDLKEDGQTIASANHGEWSAGVVIRQGPEVSQAEALRQAINAKNELYFYRWRPQNETYLFGFRKYEQGQNAREIPLFDPLVEAKEAEIAKLRVPVPHVYELIREGEVGK